MNTQQQHNIKTLQPQSKRLRWRDRRNRRLFAATLIAGLAGLVYLTYWHTYRSRFAATNNAYVTGNLIPLKAQTNGTVIDVRADDTQFVQRGEVLVRLDGLQAQVAQEQAEANLAETVRQVETLFSQVDTLRQKLAKKEAVLNRNKSDLARYRSVAANGAVSAQQIETAEFTVREYEADVRQTRAELRGAEALVHGRQAAQNPKVRQAAAALKQAYLDRVRQDIVAPLSGYIAKRTIQPGEQVHPDTPLMAIVPLDYLWIEANFLEQDLTDVRPGQTVEISVDLYGSEVIYHGEVLGLGAGSGSVFGLLPPDNATGNYIHISERVPVRISLHPEELQAHPLRPGLSAFVRIDTRSPGRPVLQPLTAIPPEAYKTDVYSHQLEGAKALIARIINENLLPIAAP